MLHHNSRSVYGEIIHVQQIFAELWSLTLRIFTHFSLSSQLLLHPCMDLNDTWQGCCTTSLKVHVGRLFMFDKFWQSYGPWHLEFLHILISCLLNSSYILAWIFHGFEWNLAGVLGHKSRWTCGAKFYVLQILQDQSWLLKCVPYIFVASMNLARSGGTCFINILCLVLFFILFWNGVKCKKCGHYLSYNFTKIW